MNASTLRYLVYRSGPTIEACEHDLCSQDIRQVVPSLLFPHPSRLTVHPRRGHTDLDLVKRRPHGEEIGGGGGG